MGFHAVPAAVAVAPEEGKLGGDVHESFGQGHQVPPVGCPVLEVNVAEEVADGGVTGLEGVFAGGGSIGRVPGDSHAEGAGELGGVFAGVGPVTGDVLDQDLMSLAAATLAGVGQEVEDGSGGKGTGTLAGEGEKGDAANGEGVHDAEEAGESFVELAEADGVLELLSKEAGADADERERVAAGGVGDGVEGVFVAPGDSPAGEFAEFVGADAEGQAQGERLLEVLVGFVADDGNTGGG